MYEQVYEPIAGNLALSTLVAVIPILVLFVLLAGIRLAAQWAEPQSDTVEAQEGAQRPQERSWRRRVFGE